MSEINYAVRDLRVYHAWQSQTALRILYENHSGVESRNLVALYVALTLKSTYNRFQDEFDTTNKAICEYTGLNHDWVPKGLRLLEEDGLIKQTERRDERGFMLGKAITLLDASPDKLSRIQKTGSSFLVGLERKDSISTNVDNNKSIKKKETSKDVRETSSPDRKGKHIPMSVWNEFSDIVEYGIGLGVLRQPKIYEDGDFVVVPKYMYKAVEKLMRLKENKFISFYKLDGKNHNPNNWREDVSTALDRLKIMKEDGRVWPTNKSTLPKDMDSFMYNDRTGFSWFIKCLEEVTTQKEERIEEKYGEIVNEDITKIFNPWFEYYFYEMDYEQEVDLKRNIGELVVYHHELWETYGKYYTKVGKWFQHLGGDKPDKFIRFYVKFLMDKNFKAHEASIRPTSKAFKAFLTYLHKEYGIDTNMGAKQRQELMNRASGKSHGTVTPVAPGNIPGVADGVLTGGDLG